MAAATIGASAEQVRTIKASVSGTLSGTVGTYVNLLAFVLQAQHPPHIAVVGDPCAYGTPEQHRDGTSSVYLKDPDGNNVEILALAAAPVESET